MMNRLTFFRRLLAAVTAVKAGKDFHLEVPTAPELPGVGMKAFELVIPDISYILHMQRGYLNIGSLFLLQDGNGAPTEFFVHGRDIGGSLLARSTKPVYDTRTQSDVYLSLVIDEGEGYGYRNDKISKLGNALIDGRSNSDDIPT